MFGRSQNFVNGLKWKTIEKVKISDILKKLLALSKPWAAVIFTPTWAFGMFFAWPRQRRIEEQVHVAWAMEQIVKCWCTKKRRREFAPKKGENIWHTNLWKSENVPLISWFWQVSVNEANVYLLRHVTFDWWGEDGQAKQCQTAARFWKKRSSLTNKQQLMWQNALLFSPHLPLYID